MISGIVRSRVASAAAMSTTTAHRRLVTMVTSIGRMPPFVGAVAVPTTALSSSSILRCSFCSAAAAPTTAAAGLRARVEYVGKLEDGSVFDSSEGREPLAFEIGAGQMIAGFDEGVVGMSVGETKELKIEPAKAYGEPDERGIQEVPLERLPEGCKVGAELATGDGQRAVVTKIEGETATVDLNHPLAGKTLNFSITLVSLEAAPKLTVTTISPGDGKTFPTAGDRLTMHYTGTLAADGSKFDSSLDRGKPFEFKIGVGQVIQGWDKGVIQMSLGEKATLHIPSAMGYGAKGAGDAIPANADLVFEVELLKIN